MKDSKFEGTQKVRFYVMSVIDNEGTTPEEKLSIFVETFKSEYGHEISRLGPQRAMTEYLRGLPSGINHAFTNYEIEALLIEWGFLKTTSTPKKVSTEVDQYWTRIAGSLVILAGRYGLNFGYFGKVA